ncbi:MAG: hypothetical protein HY882_01935, partial [Deltaproteobacteria bacterium]|nr:hypothetical protein [Deltaproteobacteria bacterium]
KIPAAEVLRPSEAEGLLRPLAQRIASAVAMPLSFVESKLGKLSDRGLIICQKIKDFYCWQWKEG